MKIIKQLSNKIKSVASGVSTFIPTQLSFWNSGQIVTSQSMNVFSQDIYEKLALLTTNINKFPVVVFLDGGRSKVTLTADKKFINLPALACAFQLKEDQGNNLPYKPYVIGYSDPTTTEMYPNVKNYIYAENYISDVGQNPTNVAINIRILALSNPTTDPNSCLLCIVDYDHTIYFIKTNFLVNSAVSTTKSANIIDPDNTYNAITPSALYLFKNQGYVSEYSPDIIYQKYEQIWTVENDAVHDYITHWISNVDNNKAPKPKLANHGNWLLASQGYYNPNNADFRTIFEGLETNSLVCESDILTNTKITSPYFIEKGNTVDHVIGKQDGTLSSGLAWVYEGRGAVKIYGIITITNNQSVALGINLDLSQQHSVNVDAVASSFTKTPTCTLLTVGNVTMLYIIQENPNFVVEWNVTVHGKLL